MWRFLPAILAKGTAILAVVNVVMVLAVIRTNGTLRRIGRNRTLNSTDAT
jgi:hypothetical protein